MSEVAIPIEKAPEFLLMYVIDVLSPETKEEVEELIKTDLHWLVMLFYLHPESIPQPIQDWLSEEDPNLATALTTIANGDGGYEWLRDLLNFPFNDHIIKTIILIHGMGEKSWANAYDVHPTIIAFGHQMAEELEEYTPEEKERLKCLDFVGPEAEAIFKATKARIATRRALQN